MDTKKFDVIGIGHPCVDYLAHIDSLPASNESRSVLNGSWQCGGKIPTGLAAAARCGLSCALIGAMGDDLFGQYCYKDFEDHGIDLSHTLIRKDATTDIGVVLSDDKTHGRNIIYRRGSYQHLSQKEIDFSFLCQADYFFVSGMDDLHVTAAKYAHEHGIKVLIDADNQPLSEYQKILPYIDYFIASEFVYNESFQDTDYRRHMEEIQELGPKTVVFTFGEDGCCALSEEGYFEIPAFKVNVLDTVGAGDTFHGAFFYGLVHKLSLKDTATFASAVSAIKCTCIGGRAGIPTPDITLDFIRTGVIHDSELKARENRYSWGLNNFFQEITHGTVEK